MFLSCSDTRFTAHAGAGGKQEEVALLQLRMSPRATVKLAGPISKTASALVAARRHSDDVLSKQA